MHECCQYNQKPLGAECLESLEVLRKCINAVLGAEVLGGAVATREEGGRGEAEEAEEEEEVDQEELAIVMERFFPSSWEMNLEWAPGF